MNVRRFTVDVPTDGSGVGLGYTPSFNGEIRQVTYVADATAPYDNTADFTVTLEATGEGVWTQSNVTASASVAPRLPTHDLVGAAALYAAAGTAVRDRIVSADDRVKIAIAQGGATKTGRFYVTVS